MAEALPHAAPCHQPWPYPVRLPAQIGVVFNVIERVELERHDLALILRTRPLPAYRHVLWWCDPEPSLISFSLPDHGQIGRCWTTHEDPVTLDLNPADTVVFRLQSPTGKWYTATRVTCNVVEALHSIGTGPQGYRLLGLSKAPFEVLMQAQQGKAIIKPAPTKGYVHMVLPEQADWSPAIMR